MTAILGYGATQPASPAYNPSKHPHTGAPNEVPAVNDAVGMWRQVVEANRAILAGHDAPPDVNVLRIYAYVEGVANTMACCDGWCQDAADERLWDACAKASNAGPGDGDAFRFARAEAWRRYIMAAAEATARVIR